VDPRGRTRNTFVVQFSVRSRFEICLVSCPLLSSAVHSPSLLPSHPFSAKTLVSSLGILSLLHCYHEAESWISALHTLFAFTFFLDNFNLSIFLYSLEELIRKI
jgi:hypothetical protein